MRERREDLVGCDDHSNPNPERRYTPEEGSGGSEAEVGPKQRHEAFAMEVRFQVFQKCLLII